MGDVSKLQRETKNTSSLKQETNISSHDRATHSDAASMVLEVACPSPMGVMFMFRGTGLLLGAISTTTLRRLF